MRTRRWSFTLLLAFVLLVPAALIGCSSPTDTPAAASAAAQAAQAPTQEKGGQDEFGPYEIVANWPQPL